LLDSDEETIRFVYDPTPMLEGALVAVDQRTGQIKAMVGGYDFDRSQFNRVVQARRQPGSAFKPLIYAAALGRAVNGVPRPVFYKGEQVGEWRDYDERLTMFLLRNRRSTRYGKWIERMLGPDPDEGDDGIALDGGLTEIEFNAPEADGNAES
jgi:hypothetical protein